jgi:hypothetical protein
MASCAIIILLGPCRVGFVLEGDSFSCCSSLWAENIPVAKQTYNATFSHAFFSSENNTAYFIRPPFFDLCEWAVKAPTVMIS